jgi:hypothetical protein
LILDCLCLRVIFLPTKIKGNFIKQINIITYFLVLFLTVFTKHVEANTCITLEANDSAQLNTLESSKCVIVKYLSSTKTALVADSSFQGNASYSVKATLPSNSQILNRTIGSNDSTFADKLNTQYYTEVKLILQPNRNDASYKFFVIHDYNYDSDESTIYIGLDSIVIPDFDPDPVPCGPEGCYIEPLMFNFNQTIVMQTSSSNQNSQCSDLNRPYQSAPDSIGNSSEKLDINEAMRDAKLWSNLLSSKLTAGQAFTARVARLIATHRTGGIYDLAHAPTLYTGSAEMGNFLYGAMGSALGLSGSTLLRGAAFYQQVNGNGWQSFSAGIYAYINNSGDAIGDAEQTLRGVRYYKEVFSNDFNNQSSISCIDQETLSSLPGDGGDGGGSGNLGGGTGGDGGFLVPPFDGGEEWCFVQTGHQTYCWFE